MTLAEKILYAHLYDEANEGLEFRRGEDYVNFRPDRVAMQDATAQMALLQFMNAGKSASAVPATVHCDHLIQAYKGAGVDLPAACEANSEVYDFLKKRGGEIRTRVLGVGGGISHQESLEKPPLSGRMVNSAPNNPKHTEGGGTCYTKGGEAVDVMTGMEWELKCQNLSG